VNSPSVFYGMAESETRTSVLPAETVASRPDSQATSTGVVILDGNTRSALAHGKLRGTEMFGHSKRLDSPWGLFRITAARIVRRLGSTRQVPGKSPNRTSPRSAFPLDSTSAITALYVQMDEVRQ